MGEVSLLGTILLLLRFIFDVLKDSIDIVILHFFYLPQMINWQIDSFHLFHSPFDLSPGLPQLIQPDILLLFMLENFSQLFAILAEKKVLVS